MKKVFVALMVTAFSYLHAALTDIDILGTSNLLKETKTTVTAKKSDGTDFDMEITKGFPAGFAEALMAVHSGYLAKWRERRCRDIPDLLLLFPESITKEGQYTLIVNKLHRDLKQIINFVWNRVNLDMLPEMIAYNILNQCRVFYEEQTWGVENSQNFDDNYGYLENLIIKKVQKLYNGPEEDDSKDKFVRWLKGSFILEFLNSFPVLHQKLLHIDPNSHFESSIKSTNQGEDAPTDLLIKLFPLVVGEALNTNVNVAGNPGMAFSKMQVEEKADFVALWLSSCQSLRNELKFLDNLSKELKKRLSINDLIKEVLKSSGGKNPPKIEDIRKNIELTLRKTNQEKKESSLCSAVSDLFRYINVKCEKSIKNEYPSISKDGYDLIRGVNKLVMKSIVYELTTFNKSKSFYPRGTTEMLIFAFCCHVFNGGRNTNGDVSVLLKALHRRGLIATDQISLATLRNETVNKFQEEINKYQGKLTAIQLKSSDKDKYKEMISAYSVLINSLNSIDLNNPKNFKRLAYIYQDYMDLRIKSLNEIIKTFSNKETKNKQIQDLTDKEGVSLEDLRVYYDFKSDVSVPYGGRCIFESNETVTVEYQETTYNYPDCVETTIRQLMTIFSNYDEENDKIIPIDEWREEVKQFFNNDCSKKELINSKNLTVHNKWATICQSVSYTNKGIEKDKQAGWRGKDGDLCSGWRNIIFMLNYLTQSNLTIPDEVSADQAVQFLQTISEHCRKGVVFQFEKEDEKNIWCTLTPKNSTKPESEIKPFKFRIYAGSGHACLKPFDSNNDNSNMTLKINSDYDIFYGKYLSDTGVEYRNIDYFWGLNFQNQNMKNCNSHLAEYDYDFRIINRSRNLYNTALQQFNRNLFIQSSKLNSTSDSIKQRYFEVLKKEIELNSDYDWQYNFLFPNQNSDTNRNDMDRIKVMDTLARLHNTKYDKDPNLFKIIEETYKKLCKCDDSETLQTKLWVRVSRQSDLHPDIRQIIEDFVKIGFGTIDRDNFNEILGY